MKIKRLLLTLGLILGCGGLFAGQKSAPVKEFDSRTRNGDIVISSQTFYFDYTAASFWGTADAITKLKVVKSDASETLRTASLEEPGSSIYSCGISLTDVVKVQFVRINPDDGTTIWNSASENTDLTKNYCNIYDNGGGNHTYSWEASKTLRIVDAGRILSGAAHVHIWTDGGDTASTTWPGRSVPELGSGLGMYSFVFKGTMDRIIINDNNGHQTTDLWLDGISNNSAFLLMPDWSGKWFDSDNQTPMYFIYSALKFESIGLDNNGETENCSTNYANAKSTYNGLSTNQERLDVLSVPLAAARLKAWAAANHDVIDDVNGDVISSARSTMRFNGSNDSTAIILGFAALSFIALSALLIVKKRKYN